MLRSLYSGITGLNSNSIEMDVIGNNIANSNTVGYKGSRVTFREMMSQTLQGASRPISGQRGGINPMQVGLGTNVGTIDTRFQQGSLQTTGLGTDLALQGDGFFMVSDGSETYYTRAGAFGLDADSYLVDPASGLKLQGVMADEDGNVQAGAWEDILIDPSLSVPAEASTSLQIFGNLDTSSEAQGTVLESDHFMAAASDVDSLYALYAQDGSDLGLQLGDQIALTGMIETAGTATTLDASTFEVGSTVVGEGGSTVDELLTWIVSQLEDLAEFDAGDLDLTIGADGSLSLVNGNGATSLLNLQLSVPANTAFNATFDFSDSIAPGETGTTDNPAASAGQLRSAATADDLLTDVYNGRGESLGLNIDALNPETVLSLGGNVGGDEGPGYELTVDATSTVADLMTGLQVALDINSSPVSIDAEGALVLEGEIGTDNALSQIEIREIGEVNPILETSFDFAETQAADDGQTFGLSSTVYDSLGNMHSVNFVFEKRVGQNEWTWTAEMEGSEEILEGASGTATFDSTGEITAFRYDDNAGQLSFRPQDVDGEGADIVSLELDAGQLGTFSGLTQHAGLGSLQSISDGYQAGELLDFEIDQDGRVVGRFSNDTLRTLARIGVASFANEGGLTQQDGSVFTVSSNSGEAMTGFAGEEIETTIVSGALEGSNVDLTSELTSLVVAQRAFQANARVVTTGDQILQEIVSILR